MEGRWSYWNFQDRRKASYNRDGARRVQVSFIVNDNEKEMRILR